MISHTSHTSPSNAKLTSKIPHLSSEVQQYKLLKSQGILGSLPTEQSSEFSDSITPISVKSQEDDRWSPSRKNPQLKVHAKHLDKIVQSTSSKTTLNTNSTSQASTYSGGSGSPPWVKETLAHYLTNFTKNLVSPDPSPLSRGSSDRLVKAAKIKSPSISSSQSNPVDVADNEKLQKTKEREVKSAQAQLTNKPKIALGRQSLASGSNRYLQVKSPTSQSAHNSQPNTERPKSGTSRSGVSLLASVVGTPKTDREVKSTKAQSMKVSKDAESWRAGNGKAGDSYDVMNKKARGSEVEKNDNRNAVVSLKEQVDTLKSMLTKYQTENAKLKEGVNNKSAQMALEASLGVKKGYTLKEMVDELKDENSNIKKTLDFLRDENDVLKKALSDVKKYQHEADYYKRLAEFKFKECSVLAEEIICLRTDLDRCNSNLVRVQKTQNAAPESGKERSESPNLLNSSLRKDSSKKIKKGVSWKEELIEKSPANRGMSARYSSKGF